MPAGSKFELQDAGQFLQNHAEGEATDNFQLFVGRMRYPQPSDLCALGGSIRYPHAVLQHGSPLTTPHGLT
eukprot:s17_g28.t1